MALGWSSVFARVRSVRRLLVILGVCLVVLMPAAAHAATRWGPVRSTDRLAAATGTWAGGSRILSLTLVDRSRGPKCAWAVVKAGGYTVPLHVCRGSKPFRFRVTETGAVSMLICSGSRRAAAGATCRTKVLV